jgi:hypothetical protein
LLLDTLGRKRSWQDPSKPSFSSGKPGKYLQYSTELLFLIVYRNQASGEQQSDHSSPTI